MKKKIFIIAMVLLISIITSIVFVACNDDKESEVVKFTSNMSQEEVFDTIDGLKSFTCEFVRSKDNVDGENIDDYFMYGENFYVYDIGFGSVYQFVDGNRYYSLTEGEKGLCEIVDYSECEINYSTYFNEIMTDGKNKFIMAIANNYCTYEVEDGNLRIVGIQRGYDCIIKNCNTTSINIPESLKDYKTRSATSQGIIYKLSTDNTCYDLYCQRLVSSFEVPQMYNELPVRISYSSIQYLEKVVLPENINITYATSGRYDLVDYGLDVVYKGTKAQWAEIDNIAKWSSLSREVKVTCSDGEYVKNN